MVLKEELVQLSQKLVSLENRIDGEQSHHEIWYSLWLDMVGALYSLFKVYPLLNDASKKLFSIKDDAKEILKLIQLDRAIEDKNHAAWFDGHYLNNAEFRISLALHCLLKTCYPCNKNHRKNNVGVPALIDKICINKEYKKECCGSDGDPKKCNKTPIPLNKRCTKILTDFYSYHSQRKSNSKLKPNNTGHYLVAVHFRVNSLKHTPSLQEDLMQTHQRMEEAWKGLLGIYELFSYIAKQRGALTRHN